MLWFILFIFGVVIGSFLNVVATRYDGDRFILSNKLIGGRSHCDACGKTLEWFELIPLVSFVMQGARCRHCRAKLSWQYPAVELASGLIFVFVPLALGLTQTAPAFAWAIAALWVVVFEALLVMSLIDIRLGIIPDEIPLMLLILGIVLAALGDPINRVLAGLGAGAFFGLLILITRGKGMGMGDLKLVVPLGLLFGWPGIGTLLVFAFLIGAVVGLVSIAFHRKTMKGTLPFGPFIAIGTVIAFFWGPTLITWYLSLLGIQ